MQTGPDLQKHTHTQKIHICLHNISAAQLTAATFAGILAANPERQFTQEAITSTGGLMTDVNLQRKTHKPHKHFFIRVQARIAKMKRVGGHGKGYLPLQQHVDA